MRSLPTVSFAAVSLAVLAAASQSAFASCSIHNDTKWDFTVESGNTSNQGVGAHTQTSIAAGRIIGRSKAGPSISGSCKDGDHLEVTEDQGVPVMVQK